MKLATHVHLLQRLRMSTAIPSIPHICLHNVQRSNVTFIAMTYSKPLSLQSRWKTWKTSRYQSMNYKLDKWHPSSTRWYFKYSMSITVSIWMSILQKSWYFAVANPHPEVGICQGRKAHNIFYSIILEKEIIRPIAKGMQVDAMHL
jgi:hypothetical protein